MRLSTVRVRHRVEDLPANSSMVGATNSEGCLDLHFTTGPRLTTSPLADHHVIVTTLGTSKGVEASDRVRQDAGDVVPCVHAGLRFPSPQLKDVH
jgi:hypothetical protein